MTFKQLLINFGKLLICGIAFFAGTVIGGMVARMLQLNPPPPPPGTDLGLLGLYSILTSPLLALALAVLARGISGGRLTRTLVLAFLTWTAYTVNTQLEASIFSTYAAGFWFAVVDYLVASLLCGAAVAFLFPSENEGEGLIAACRAFFGRRAAIDWMWRLVAAAIAFMPIYFLFGMMVVPFTAEYYRQNMFGLAMPTIDQILPILFIRSVLFLLACLPVIILWQKSEQSLFLRLGFALYVLVGFIFMLISTWLPIYVRLPHALEILADEFVYAGVLVALLARRGAPAREAARSSIR